MPRTFTIKDRSNCYIDHVVTITKHGTVKAYCTHSWPDDFDPYVYGVYWTKTEDPTQVPAWVTAAVAEKANNE